MSNAQSADLLVTRDGIKVGLGQRWRDLDKRMSDRVVEVVEVNPHMGRVRVQRVGFGKNGGSWVLVRRMHRHSTGFELVL